MARVLNIPLTFLLFSAQYHNWNIFAAFVALYPICHVFNFLQMLLQFSLFLSIFHVARGAANSMLVRTETKAE